MSFMAPVCISADIIRESHKGYGGIAVNIDSTLFASVDSEQHCVYIYSLVDTAADPVVFGTVGTRGSANEQLNSPISTCFVRRDCKDTLLITDLGNNRVVEVSADGTFVRAIAMNGRFPYGIAYCGNSDIIAVTLKITYWVVLFLQYESGAVKPEVTIGSGTARRLSLPLGVAFTADGRYLLVADNHCVSKFNAASGEFITHVATKAANGICSPRGVLQCEDGSIVVALAYYGSSSSVVHVGADGETINEFIIPNASGGNLHPCLLFNSVLVKCLDGSLFVLRDTWSPSPRCAWLHACVG